MKLSIRKIGNSAGIIIPSTLLRSLNISVGSSVNVEQVDGALILTPATKPRYSLNELMALCDAKVPVPEDIKAWDSLSPIGNEIA